MVILWMIILWNCRGTSPNDVTLLAQEVLPGKSRGPRQQTHSGSESGRTEQDCSAYLRRFFFVVTASACE